MEEHNASNKPRRKRQRRKSGGQPRNQNAVKHGFYSSFLTAAERRKLREARGIKGVKDDLDFLRVKLGTMSSNPEVTLSQVAAAFGVIARLATADHRISMTRNEAEGLEESIAAVLDGIGRTMGLGEYRDAERDGEG